MKKLRYFLPLLFVFILHHSFKIEFVAEQPDYSSGPAFVGLGDRTGSPISGGANCGGCHSGGSFNAVTTIIVRDSALNSVFSYTPGTTYNIIVSINNLAGSPGGFGFQAVAISPTGSFAQAGTMNSVNTANTRISSFNGRSYAEHSNTSPLDGFSVSWTAPSTGFGDVAIYATGLCVNGNGGTSGDQHASTSITLTEQCVNTVTQDVQSSCTPFTWIDGITYSSSNNSASVTLTSIGGCDSIVNLDLTINAPTAATDVQSACDSYQWIDGQTYTASNNSATVTLTNAAGCDSVVTLDLTITNSTAATDVQSACDSYTWIDSQTYTASNNSATVTLTNAAGCDSVITLDLTITNSTAATDVQSACDSYTWIDGQTYTTSNNSATVTLTNAAGCDSVVTLDLTINSVSDNTVSQTGATLTANNSNATYQWIDCDNGNAAIGGATAQVYTATANGNYAVVLTENGCTDTSACVNVVLSSTHFLGNERIQVYPNPTTNNINIDFSSPQTDIQLRIYDALGQLVFDKRYTQRDLIQVALPQLTGLYLLELQTYKGTAVFRVLKE